jgi:hypothetical protein
MGENLHGVSVVLQSDENGLSCFFSLAIGLVLGVVSTFFAASSALDMVSRNDEARVTTSTRVTRAPAAIASASTVGACLCLGIPSAATRSRRLRTFGTYVDARSVKDDSAPLDPTDPREVEDCKVDGS